MDFLIVLKTISGPPTLTSAPWWPPWDISELITTIFLKKKFTSKKFRRIEMFSDMLDYKAKGIRERADKIDRDIDVW